MELIKQARTKLIRQIKNMREQNIDPTARSYLQSLQDTLTIDLNNSAEAYTRKSGDVEFADVYAGINRFYAKPRVSSTVKLARLFTVPLRTQASWTG